MHARPLVQAVLMRRWHKLCEAAVMVDINQAGTVGVKLFNSHSHAHSLRYFPSPPTPPTPPSIRSIGSPSQVAVDQPSEATQVRLVNIHFRNTSPRSLQC